MPGCPVCCCRLRLYRTAGHSGGGSYTGAATGASPLAAAAALLLLSVASAVHLAANSTRCFMLLRQPLGGSRGSEQHPPLARGGGARSNGCRFNPKNVFLSDLFDQRDSWRRIEDTTRLQTGVPLFGGF